MGSRNRYDYMKYPNHNPPTDECQECQEPSKVHFLGGKTVDEVTTYRKVCEHGHEWITKDNSEVDSEQ